jgi:hypothetical protein
LRQHESDIAAPDSFGIAPARPARALLAAASRFVLAASLTVLALGSSGCENNRTKLTKEQSEGGLGVPDSSSDGKRVKLDPRCELNETVMDPKEGTPEFVIFKMLEAAAASGDEAKNFKQFYSYFPADKEEKWVRDQYWPRARKFVNKYLQQDAGSGIAFKICERREEGGGELKIFIQSLDPQKSNPPIKLKKDDTGAWKVTFYTP